MDDSTWTDEQTQRYGDGEDASTSTSTETDTHDVAQGAEPEWIENPLYEEPSPDASASSDADHVLSPEPELSFVGYSC
jgi:hypothetical protein